MLRVVEQAPAAHLGTAVGETDLVDDPAEGDGRNAETVSGRSSSCDLYGLRPEGV
ncbi:hypothetical protein GCM10010464_09770 [Pseudonocardia yunnanensis]